MWYYFFSLLIIGSSWHWLFHCDCMMHFLLSGGDFVPTLWYFFVFFTYYRKFVTLIIPLWLMHCLLSGGDFIILIWYYPTRFVLEQQQEHVMSLRLIMLMDPKQDTPLIIYLYQLCRYIYFSLQQDTPLIIDLYQLYRYIYFSLQQAIPLIIYLYQLYRYIYCSLHQNIPLIIYLYQLYRYVYMPTTKSIFRKYYHL